LLNIKKYAKITVPNIPVKTIKFPRAEGAHEAPIEWWYINCRLQSGEYWEGICSVSGRQGQSRISGDAYLNWWAMTA